MIVEKSSPWVEIKIPNQDYNVRKVREAKGLPIYWGKDSVGNYLLIVILPSSDHADLFNKLHVPVRGIHSDLRFMKKNNSQGLIITLENHVDIDLFTAMCKTLITSLKNVVDSATGLSIALNQIKRWKAFMASKRKGVLTSEQVKGLFGEIKFLQQLLRQINEDEAINSWEGPESAEQDFIFRNSAIEVKTLSSKNKRTVPISSEYQLMEVSERLFLKLYRLVQMPNSDKAASLNQLIKQVSDEISEYSVRELFHDKLAKAGYVELSEYENPKFVISDSYLFHVSNKFPKLTREMLPDGVSMVRYSIDFDRIKSFIVRNDYLWDK